MQETLQGLGEGREYRGPDECVFLLATCRQSQMNLPIQTKGFVGKVGMVTSWRAWWWTGKYTGKHGQLKTKS